MASSSSSSSLSLALPSSSLSRSWERDVFPSFHGPDVRKHFLSHVLKEFRNKGINPFIDNEIKRGKSIGPRLKRAIRGSKISVVLLSKNYASSSWCLDELVEIMNKEFGQIVITIFYEVDPSDVKKRSGYFGKVFNETCQGKTKEKIEIWKKALMGVATIAGYHSRNWVDEAVMIENIASDISNMLNKSAPSSDLDCFIGLRAHMEKMKLLLCLDLDEVRMIGIWGPPGIGKSTIARFIFNQLSSSFQLSTIMVNVKGSYPRPCLDEGSAQLQLQNQMLSQMVNQKDIMISHLGVAQERLKDKKVFLVLDDVDRLAQLDALAKEVHWFGSKSRIIVTTEDLRVLRAHGINHIYKVHFPSNDEALQMFCMHAFGQKSPKVGFIELAHEVTYLVGKLPLGLKVMGSYLRRMSKQEWIRVLPRLRNRLDGEIESILRFSYDALCDEDKDLFLHLACNFSHGEIKKVEEHLSNKFLDVWQGLFILAEKSLINFNWERIEMHSLLVQLGHEIVRKQSDREPGQRLFLVNYKDIYEVFSDPTAIARSVIGIYARDMMKSDKLNVSEKTFEGMSNLQFLTLYGGELLDNPNIKSLPERLKYISPKLQLLNWDSSPMTCLPFIANLEFLVELIMVRSKLEKLWDGIKLLQNLRWMDLSFSVNLKELPNLSTATNLEKLNLEGCSSLVELPSSIGNATNLQDLYLSYCSSLVEIPSSIENATNLKTLTLWECSRLVNLPSSIGKTTYLYGLGLSHCSSLVELPSFIGYINIQVLQLDGCSSLVELPSSIKNFPWLEKINLEGCSKLEVLPTNINLEYLDELNLANCSLLKTFPQISTNIKILKLNGTAVEEVPLAITSWYRLEKLHMSYSENFKDLPHALDRITELHLSNAEIQELGPWVKGFSYLHRLQLNGCRKLVSLPQLPDSLSVLDAENCESLERLDWSLCNTYCRLNFRNCFQLNQDARELIIQTHNVSVLPGGEVPACFTYRDSGSFLTVRLNEKPRLTRVDFKACILLVNEGEDKVNFGTVSTVACSITSKQNALTSCTSYSTYFKNYMSEHLYTFDVVAEEVTSTELVFEFKLEEFYSTWKIKECGILHLVDLQDDEDYDSFTDGEYDSEYELNFEFMPLDIRFGLRPI